MKTTLSQPSCLQRLACLLVSLSLGMSQCVGREKGQVAQTTRPGASRACVGCHAQSTPGAVHQWESSSHARHGIGCLDCHAAAPGDSAAILHHDASIVMIVGAKDCARCHPREAQETQVSGHAGLQEGLDVSRGACLVCHYNHSFELASAREPQICERCHAAADHPIMDAYAVSKHGVLFRTQYDRMNLRAQPWVVGRDYWAAPTCATCHMSATPTQSVTHSTGSRLAFSPGAAGWLRTDGWQARRARMADVCGQCHSQSWLKGYFADFDRRRQSAARVPQAMPLR